MQHSLLLRGAGLVGVVALLGCNSLTGVGDLQVSGGAGGESAAGGASHAGGGGVGAAGVGGAGVGGTASSTGGASTVGSTSSSAGTPASSSSSSGTTTSVTTTGTSMSNDPAQLCVDTINGYRSTRGLPPLTRWTSNEACVSGEAQTDGMMMSAHYAFGHGMSCSSNAQNECPNYASDPTTPNDGITTCLQLMWNEKNQAACAGCDSCDFPYQGCTNCEFDGPDAVCGHYLNMKSSVLTTVACGFWTGGWYAQNYM